MAKQLTRSAVRVYGALSALSNNTGSIMQGLLPFFDPILRPITGEKFDPREIARAIRDTYNWNFTADLAEAFVPHLEQHGWITADVPASPGFTTYTISITDDDALDPTKTIEDDLRRIATEFRTFSENLSPLTAIPREIEEFEDILVEWLLYVEAFSEKNIQFETIFRPN